MVGRFHGYADTMTYVLGKPSIPGLQDLQAPGDSVDVALAAPGTLVVTLQK